MVAYNGFIMNGLKNVRSAVDRNYDRLSNLDVRNCGLAHAEVRLGSLRLSLFAR